MGDEAEYLNDAGEYYAHKHAIERERIARSKAKETSPMIAVKYMEGKGKQPHCSNCHKSMLESSALFCCWCGRKFRNP